MNAVEIEEAISLFADQPFDAAEFPYGFLEAFGNKATTIKRLRTGNSNQSDVENGVLQRNNIHIAVAPRDQVYKTLDALRASPATAKQKAKFILATDGAWIEAENRDSGDVIACPYAELPDNFGFFLPLAGIHTVAEIVDNPIDIRATSRLNKLYIELLKHNPAWGTAERRHDMNHFMARLIFCFYAEDTDIFIGDNLFTATAEQMAARDGSDMDHVIGEIFRAMNTKAEDRPARGIKSWADSFPYVNGGLFADSVDVPQFTRTARSYLLYVGKLDWKQINPDIFGSMIQAVADEEERETLGMHYTSVPNILKLLNPLFLDDLRAQLEDAGDNGRKLLNLRKRLSRIRVFDPACGSGNFLVIAYKQMREIEYEINRRRDEKEAKSQIHLTNFRGIELRDFSAEIARLALIIAEYQCDVMYRGQRQALAEFLPLNADNWITRGNALRLDWLSLCPPTGTGVKLRGDDLFNSPLDQTQIDFETDGGETYICGNPPYRGSTWQSAEQKKDLEAVFKGHTTKWKLLDYVAGWFMKAADYGRHTPTATAFVATNSICQGQQVGILWPVIFQTGHDIYFAHTSFKWANLARYNAGVTVVIVGLAPQNNKAKRLFFVDQTGASVEKKVPLINGYLVAAAPIIVHPSPQPLGEVSPMAFGNKPVDGGHLLMTRAERDALALTQAQSKKLIRRIFGAAEFIKGQERYVLWIEDQDREEAEIIPQIRARIDKVKAMRLASRDTGANDMAARPHQMREMHIGKSHTIVIAAITSENRDYLPVGILEPGSTITNQMYGLFDAPLWNMAILASKLHRVWVDTVCSKLGTSYRYSNTLGWHSFPVPPLSAQNKQDLTLCAEDILLAREAHFPATIADLYNPDSMPDNLRRTHERNDEVLERVYIGRRFKNDSERLEKLFALYATMTSQANNGEHSPFKKPPLQEDPS